MRITTERFGEIEYNENDIITFPKGILGFEGIKKYILFSAGENKDNPFYFLQSIEQSDLCFFTLDTLSFFQKYDIEIDESTTKDLDINEPTDVKILTIVTLKGSLKEATTNLKAPIVINKNEKVGKQSVLEKGDYLLKQPLFPEDQVGNKIGAKG
jgi:flagellar assembly factor FliW